MTSAENPHVRGWRRYDDSPVEPAETPIRPAPFAWYFGMWPMNGTPNDATLPTVGGIVFLGLGLGFAGVALHYGALSVGICLGLAFVLPGIGLVVMARSRLDWHRRNPDIDPGSYVPIKPPLGHRRPLLVLVLDIALIAVCLILAFIFGLAAFSVVSDPTPIRARTAVVISIIMLCGASVLTGVFAIRRIHRRRNHRGPR